MIPLTSPFLKGLILVTVLFLTSCSGRDLDPYAPHETLISIAAEYQLLTHNDPYSDQPIRDTTGQHIARSTLVRLANYEALEPDRFPLEVLVLKARAYEWLGDHELAAKLYSDAALEDSELREDSQLRSEQNRQIANIQSGSSNTLTIEELVSDMEMRIDRLEQLAGRMDDELYQSFALRALETMEVARAELLATNRYLFEGGTPAAVAAMKDMVRNHNKSARRFEHALRLARFYRELAEEEIRLNPPTAFDFDTNLVLINLEDSLDLLYRVSQADGYPEKVIAERELDTVLALREYVIRASR